MKPPDEIARDIVRAHHRQTPAYLEAAIAAALTAERKAWEKAEARAKKLDDLLYRVLTADNKHCGAAIVIACSLDLYEEATQALEADSENAGH